MPKTAVQLAEEALAAADAVLKQAKQAANLAPVDFNIVIDRSGSMESIRADTIGGYNAFLKKQQALPGEATLSYYQFDTVYEAVHVNKPIRDVPELTMQTYVPRGGTALLDAIGRTINSVASRNPPKPVIVIITDGEENSSKEFRDAAQIQSMIKDKEKLGWEFVFIGAGIDAIKTGSALGFGTANTMRSAANSIGTQSMFDSLSANTAAYRSGEVKTMAFTNAQLKAQEEAEKPKAP